MYLFSHGLGVYLTQAPCILDTKLAQALTYRIFFNKIFLSNVLYFVPAKVRLFSSFIVLQIFPLKCFWMSSSWSKVDCAWDLKIRINIYIYCFLDVWSSKKYLCRSLFSHLLLGYNDSNYMLWELAIYCISKHFIGQKSHIK